MPTELDPAAAGGTEAADPLRRTLDTLHLDPNAAADRPYLESMLRRLGYSEAEIQAYLGRSAAAPPAPATTTAPDAGGERTVEVEYTGPGLKEFKLAIGVEAGELPAITAEEAGTEVFEAGPSMEEVDRLVAEGGLDDFDDWGDTTPKEDALGEVGEAAPGEAKPEGEARPEGEAAKEGEAEEGEAPALKVEKGSAAGTEIGLPEKPGALGPDFQTGESLVEFQPIEFNEPEAVTVPDAAAEAEALRAEGWEVAGEGGEFEVATWEYEEPQPEAQPLPEPAGEPFTYKEWTLYSRDELRGDQPQRIYFFGKGPTEGSDPAPMPEGYEVAENPDTGRPFLRRAEESAGFAPAIESAHPSADPGAAPKKRVRILRVRAASREEAVKKLQAEGRNVIASMPIDIEKRFGE